MKIEIIGNKLTVIAENNSEDNQLFDFFFDNAVMLETDKRQWRLSTTKNKISFELH